MRKISELIWHCTATREGEEFSVAEIRRWHTDPQKWIVENGKRRNIGGRGWSDIGYHKVVHLDGSVSEGRPESKIGSHVAGRNTGTIGYVYVGGVERDGKTPKDTRTPAQKRTMKRLTLDAIKKYGLTLISGHHDYAAKACPCFPARREYGSLLKAPVIAPPAPLPEELDRDVGMPEKDPADVQARDDTAAIATGATGVAGAGATLSEVTEKIEPLAYYSDYIMMLFLGLTVAGVGILVWSRMRRR